MKCSVYRSDRKPETYLYLAKSLEFAELPEDLQRQFGTPAFVMELDCTPGTKLARVDARRVLQALESQGFFLQMPPKLPVEEEIARRFS